MIDELCEYQKKKVLQMARRIIPHLTEEDIMQPNDFPELEENPHFRYEEGVWHGLLSAKTAFQTDQRSDQQSG